MDLEMLRTKGAELKARIRDLTSERARHAPAAINGDAGGPQARQRISAIDVERASAQADLETIEQALASPQFRHEGLRERLDQAFERRLPGLKGMLAVMVGEKYGNLSHRDNLVTLDIELADLPRMIAAELTGEMIAGQDLDGLKRFAGVTAGMVDNTDKLARLEIEFAARKAHTDRLLAETTLPPIPPELKAIIDRREVRKSWRLPGVVWT